MKTRVNDKNRIAVLDGGGQYCHLIARRIRLFGVNTEVLPYDVSESSIEDYSGVVLSGSPSSVAIGNGPRIAFTPEKLKIPVLGICYGHQTLASMAGGRIENNMNKEFGPAKLNFKGLKSQLFRNVRNNSLVWMSHGEGIKTLPKKFSVIGTTGGGRLAAIKHNDKDIFGLQFHPEVSHTTYGTQIIQNFVLDICKCEKNWSPTDRISTILENIKKQAEGKSVVFFISGGVDSTVSLWLTAKVLPHNSITAVFLDTGFLKSDDLSTARTLSKYFPRINFEFLDESQSFFSAVKGVTDPEMKRKLIGENFYKIIKKKIHRKFSNSEKWLLGQGTIYPDTIETAGSSKSALIKTHHNRSKSFKELEEKGGLLEPLKEFYKDEVRALAKELDIPKPLVKKHPFPGPGLAIRNICSRKKSVLKKNSKISDILAETKLVGAIAPIYSVGVKGDARSYEKLVVLQGETTWKEISRISSEITNSLNYVNRVAWMYRSNQEIQLFDFKVTYNEIGRQNISLLRSVDDLVTKTLKDNRLYDKIWQCPVVLVPLSFRDRCSIALRPVKSSDGMTAQFAEIDFKILDGLCEKLFKTHCIDAILYDVTNKPPGTIEWE